MNITKANNLACPIDGKNLTQTDKQFVCENGHTYDIARQGYVNLLPVQHKRSKSPGDSKAMVSARTQFLDTNLYQPIAAMLNEIVLMQIINDKHSCILDAGCGEGYYFNELLSFLSNQTSTNSISLIGLDISKNAVVQATKRNENISWIVGTNRQPPVLSDSVDLILCLFGFLNVDGFARILKPGGKIILVDPNVNHLKELREIIYSEVKQVDEKNSSHQEVTGFTLIQSKALQFKVMINNNQQINNLLAMTPHFYRASREGKELASGLEKLEVTIDVTFKVLEKNK